MDERDHLIYSTIDNTEHIVAILQGHTNELRQLRLNIYELYDRTGRSPSYNPELRTQAKEDTNKSCCILI